MQIHNYDPTNRVYLRTSDAQIDPLESQAFGEDRYLIPAYSTDKPLPPVGANEVAVFDPAADNWTIQPDHRGQTYYRNADGQAVKITEIGPIAADLTSQEPPCPNCSWDEIAGWVPDIDKLSEAKREELKAACRTEIEGGSPSEALGSRHTYPTTVLDQHNMTSLWATTKERGAGGEPYRFWCCNEDGVWDRREHSATQLSVAGLAMADHVIAQQDRYKDRLDQIEAAVVAYDEALTQEAINAAVATLEAIAW